MGSVGSLAGEHWLQRWSFRWTGHIEQRCRLGARLLALETPLDDLQGEEVLALLPEDPSQPIDVVVVEFPVARWRSFRDEETSALKEPDLRDRDVRKLLSQEGEDVAN
jgi:hypothetical protein